MSGCWSSYAGCDIYTEKAAFALKHSQFQRAERRENISAIPVLQKGARKRLNVYLKNAQEAYDKVGNRLKLLCPSQRFKEEPAFKRHMS